jgi:GNAT superfamily N-acetyltransferase
VGKPWFTGQVQAWRVALDLSALALTDAPAPGVFEAIFRALDAESAPLIGPTQVRLLVLPIHDDDGTIRGGLWGSTLFEWFYVQMLVVPAVLRGRGIGRCLMRLAEGEARARGCRGAFVDTFSFQAEDFYRKLGYTCFGELPDFPPGHRRIFLFKRLSAAGALSRSEIREPA